jgi:hypothetical protein
LEGGSLAQVLSRSSPFFHSCCHVAWALASAIIAVRAATVFMMMFVVEKSDWRKERVTKYVKNECPAQLRDLSGYRGPTPLITTTEGQSCCHQIGMRLDPSQRIVSFTTGQKQIVP